MRHIRLVQLASLTVILGVAMVGHPKTSGALSGCAEMIGCSTEEACEISDGEPCDEEGCEGTQVCANDVHEQCTGGPACSLYECKVLLCADWVE